MVKKRYYLLLFLILTFACQQKTEQEEIVDYLVKVNHEILTQEEFESNFTSQELESMTQQKKQNFIDKWINLTLLAQEADNQNISENIRIKTKIKNAIKKIKSNALIVSTLSNIKVDEEELFNYYRVHKNNYTKNVKEYELQRIFSSDEEKIKEVSQRIQSKELSFDQAARKFSEEPLASKSGYAGFVSKDEIPNEIWETLENLKKWHFSTVKTESGYYIVMYHNVRTVDKGKSFVEAKEEIRKILINKKKEDIYKELLDNLKTKANISKNF